MSARPLLEAILFDAGGTLVRLDFEWMAEAIAGLGLALDPEALRRAEVEGRRRFDASHGTPATAGSLHPPLGGRGDIRAYFGGMLDAVGVPAPVAARSLEAFEARHRAEGLWTRPVEGAREALDAIERLGVRRAVVSNSDGRAEQHLVDCGVRAGLEFVVDSQIVGVEKPDPRIFRIALERMGVDAGRALYVGDILSVDAAGARAAGMHFVLLDPLGDYEEGRVPAIPGIDRLPQYLHDAFDVRSAIPAARGNGAAPGGG